MNSAANNHRLNVSLWLSHYIKVREFNLRPSMPWKLWISEEMTRERSSCSRNMSSEPEASEATGGVVTEPMILNMFSMASPDLISQEM